MKWIGIGLWAGLWIGLTACSVVGDSSEKTATPLRPVVREAIYESIAQESRLTVTLDTLTLLAPEETNDTQILAVLADGTGQPSYMLFPSNQPGILESSITLNEYPLRFNPTTESALLWVLAIRHTAYPITETIGQATIAQTLAMGLDSLIAQNSLPDSGRPLVQIIASSTDLLAWYGQAQVVGEATHALAKGQNWSAGSQTLESSDGGWQLTYTISVNTVIANAPTLPATTIPTIEPSPTPNGDYTAMEQPIDGYRLVVDEKFTDATSKVEWFIGSDPTYAASLVVGGYQIVLTGIDDNRDVGLSWGSVQGYVFNDYVVRARMRVLESGVLARYGLWLHYQDDFNFLFFGLENTGRYRIARFKNGYTELVPWNTSPVILLDNQTNEMEVKIDGNDYTLKVNGMTVATASDAAFRNGRLAFFCYSPVIPSTCQLQALEIWIPEGSEFPLSTFTPVP